ncbi:MAG: type VI secretion system protein, partial [Acidobacteriota bacterium]|nr:type VI secretion system protein [Acidobacteriota bacterium]
MLSAYWPYILLLLVLLVLGTALLIYLLLRRARKRAAAPQTSALAPVVVAPESPAQPHTVSSLGLKSSFARAVRLLRTHVTRRDYRYRLPWLLAVGEADSGKTTLLSETGLSLPLGRPAEQPHGVKQGVNWFFFDRGVVLDVAGDYVLRPNGEPSNRRGWREIARLLQKYRPERPLDGVVLTIPCTDLVTARGFDGRARIEQKAATLYRKLWQAQKLLGMSFPVYVIITKCDEIAGFRSLCRELPARAREQMFGWSSPYTLETAYRPEWIEEAFQNVYRYLFQIQVEVFAEHGDVRDPDSLFMLPTEMQALKAPLQLYLDHVFKESSFHDSFFFRGLYFCGDAGDETTQAVATVEAPLDDDWLAASPDPFAPTATAPPAEGPRKPAFLKDLFEKKIFPEDMLARPVVKATLSRNRTALVCQVLALAIPIIGLIGLLTTYAGLERRSAELHRLLAQEETDLMEVKNKKVQREGGGRRPRAADFYPDSYQPSAYIRPGGDARAPRTQEAAYLQPAASHAEASNVGEPAAPAPEAPRADAAPPADGTQDNETHLLSAMARADVKNYYSFFIPSSWFSDLNASTNKSLVAAFHYVILDDLRLALEERTDDILQAATAYDYAPVLYAPASDLQRTSAAPPANAAPSANVLSPAGANPRAGEAPGAPPDTRA